MRSRQGNVAAIRSNTSLVHVCGQPQSVKVDGGGDVGGETGVGRGPGGGGETGVGRGPGGGPIKSGTTPHSPHV